MKATIPARASWRLQRARRRGLAGINPTPPREVTATSCGDLLADKFRELCPSGARGHQRKEHGPTFDVAGTVEHSREDGLGELQRDRDPVSIYPSSFALCTFAALSLLLDLNGLFHRSVNLLLRGVVVVDMVLDLERRLGGGRLELGLCCLERDRFLVPSDD